MQTAHVQIAPAKHSRRLVLFNGSVDSTVAVQETLRTTDVDLLIITGPDWGVTGLGNHDPKNVITLLRALAWVLNEASQFKIKDILFYQHNEPYIAKHSLQSFSECKLPENDTEQHKTMKIMTVLQAAAQAVSDVHYATVLSIYTGEKHAAYARLYGQVFDLLRSFRQNFPNVLEFPLVGKTGADVLDLLHPVNGVMAMSISDIRDSSMPELATFEWERYMTKHYPELQAKSYQEEFQDAIGRYSKLSNEDKIRHFQEWKGLSFEIVKLRGGDA